MGRTLVANRRLAGSACGKRRMIRPLNSVVETLPFQTIDRPLRVGKRHVGKRPKAVIVGTGAKQSFSFCVRILDIDLKSLMARERVMSIKFSKRETATLREKIRKVTQLPCPYDCWLIRRPGSDNLPVFQCLKDISTAPVLLAITRMFLRLNNCWANFAA